MNNYKFNEGAALVILEHHPPKAITKRPRATGVMVNTGGPSGFLQNSGEAGEVITRRLGLVWFAQSPFGGAELNRRLSWASISLCTSHSCLRLQTRSVNHEIAHPCCCGWPKIT